MVAGRQDAERNKPARHPPKHGAHAIQGPGIIRVVATLILTFVILVVFLAYLLSTTIFGNLFDAGFYTVSFSENRIYDRFYDEVLLDEEVEEVRIELLGNIQVVSSEDIVRLAREILPPDYAQEQVETSIESLIGYLGGEDDSLEMLIDLGPPLDRAKPVLLGYIDERIDEVPDAPVNNLDELEANLEALYDDLSGGRLPSSIPSIEDPTAVVAASVENTLGDLPVVKITGPLELAEDLNSIYVGLASGRIPDSIPSIEAISPIQRELFVQAYDSAVALLSASPSIPADVRQNAVQALQEHEEAVKESIRAGDIRDAIVPVVAPLVEDAVDDYIDTVYDEAVRSLEEQGGLSQESLDNLDAQEDAIKALLAGGDVRGSLKLASRSIAGPVIDESIEEIRDRLVEPGDGSEPRMLDLVQWAADEEGVTREALLEEWRLEDVRSFAGRVGQGETILLAILALASVGAVSVYLPRVSSGLFWLAGILMTVGSVGLVIGVILRAMLPTQVYIWFNDLLLDSNNDLPRSGLNIARDVLHSMAKDAAVDWVLTSVYMVAAGVAVLAVALLAKRLKIPLLSK